MREEGREGRVITLHVLHSLAGADGVVWCGFIFTCIRKRLVGRRIRCFFFILPLLAMETRLALIVVTVSIDSLLFQSLLGAVVWKHPSFSTD